MRVIYYKVYSERPRGCLKSLAAHQLVFGGLARVTIPCCGQEGGKAQWWHVTMREELVSAMRVSWIVSILPHDGKPPSRTLLNIPAVANLPTVC